MQNKPNFQKSQMNANLYNTTDYERKRDWTLGKNKPNSNPIKPNFQKAKMNVNLTLTKDYRKNDDFIVRINKPNSRKTQNGRKRFFTKGLWKWTAFRPKKTNPIKPNFFKGQNELKIACRKIWPHLYFLTIWLLLVLSGCLDYIIKTGFVREIKQWANG